MAAREFLQLLAQRGRHFRVPGDDAILIDQFGMLFFVFRQLAAVQFRLLMDDRQLFFRADELVFQLAGAGFQPVDLDQLGLVLIGIDAVFGLRFVDLRFGHDDSPRAKPARPPRKGREIIRVPGMIRLLSNRRKLVGSRQYAVTETSSAIL